MKCLVSKLMLCSVAAAASAGVVVTVSAGPAAAAKHVICDEAGQCVTKCSQQLPNGGWVDYDEGTEISVTHPDGETVRYKCVNGNWERQAAFIVSRGKVAGILNTRGSLMGIKGEITQTTCGHDGCVESIYTIGPVGRLSPRDPGCDTDQVACLEPTGPGAS